MPLKSEKDNKTNEKSESKKLFEGKYNIPYLKKQKKYHHSKHKERPETSQQQVFKYLIKNLIFVLGRLCIKKPFKKQWSSFGIRS